MKVNYQYMHSSCGSTLSQWCNYTPPCASDWNVCLSDQLSGELAADCAGCSSLWCIAPQTTNLPANAHCTTTAVQERLQANKSILQRPWASANKRKHLAFVVATAGANRTCASLQRLPFFGRKFTLLPHFSEHARSHSSAYSWAITDAVCYESILLQGFGVILCSILAPIPPETTPASIHVIMLLAQEIQCLRSKPGGPSVRRRGCNTSHRWSICCRLSALKRELYSPPGTARSSAPNRIVDSDCFSQMPSQQTLYQTFNLFA